MLRVVSSARCVNKSRRTSMYGKISCPKTDSTYKYRKLRSSSVHQHSDRYPRSIHPKITKCTLFVSARHPDYPVKLRWLTMRFVCVEESFSFSENDGAHAEKIYCNLSVLSCEFRRKRANVCSTCKRYCRRCNHRYIARFPHRCLRHYERFEAPWRSTWPPSSHGP